MKKIIYLFLLTSFALTAQNKLSYGVVFGSNFYDSANDNGTYSFSSTTYGGSDFNYGGYLEYNFTNNMGIKTEITLIKRQLSFRQFSGSNLTDFDFSYFEVAPSFKYDFGQEYRKGFYLLFGPKISIMTKADVDGEDFKDIFNTTNVGAQFGLGQRVFKYVDIEAKLDYEITPFFKRENYKSTIFGAYLALTVDLEKIINIQ
jgi:Outer membrane protein beta-barrel domain